MEILTFSLPLVLSLFFIHFSSKLFAKYLKFFADFLREFPFKGDNL